MNLGALPGRIRDTGAQVLHPSVWFCFDREWSGAVDSDPAEQISTATKRFHSGRAANTDACHRKAAGRSSAFGIKHTSVICRDDFSTSCNSAAVAVQEPPRCIHPEPPCHTCTTSRSLPPQAAPAARENIGSIYCLSVAAPTFNPGFVGFCWSHSWSSLLFLPEIQATDKSGCMFLSDCSRSCSSWPHWNTLTHTDLSFQPSWSFSNQKKYKWMGNILNKHLWRHSL